MRILITLLMLFISTGAIAQSTGSVLIKNATVITVTGEDLTETDILVRNGLISQIGKNLSAPSGVSTVDATGKFVLPGIIDAHSHLAISRV